MINQEPKKYAVGMIEDDRVMRSCWEIMLRKQEGVFSVDSWESAEGFFASEAVSKLDLLLVDLELPGLSGFEILHRLQQDPKGTVCIVLTASSNPEDVFTAIRAGASGYLVKQASPEVLMQNIETVIHDGMTFSPAIAKLIAQAFLKVDPRRTTSSPIALQKLTDRELEILELIQRLGNAKSVAARLGLSHETVRAHLKRVYQKLHVNSKDAAVALLAMRRA